MNAPAAAEQHALFVRVKDGGVFVPSSTQYLTTYVLIEQEDWFEKEIGFVRRALQPGMRAIDVGANYGLYTLALARAVTTSGFVWAFEPTDQTRKFLRQTVAANALTSVQVCSMGLSDHEGAGLLNLNGNSELNRLAGASTAASQQVSLTTLDAQCARGAMDDIDFVKLDAEGAEFRIVQGSPRFFNEQSPLVMFELRDGNQLNVELPRAFRAMGYVLYRLVGPDLLLVPVRNNEAYDSYELNLFACKPDRARRLAAQALLVLDFEPASESIPGSGLAYWRSQPFAAGWPLFDGAARGRTTQAWIDYYASWRDVRNSPGIRFAALQASIKAMQASEGAVDLAGPATLARLLLEAGARQQAVQALDLCLARAEQGVALGTGVLWPPSQRYDTIVPVGQARDWLVASAVQAQACAANFSDYFSGANYLPVLDWLQSTPYANPPMERRRQLQAVGAGRQSNLRPSPLLTSVGPEHLNPQLWGGPR